jgi:hypothetical protein
MSDPLAWVDFSIMIVIPCVFDIEKRFAVIFIIIIIIIYFIIILKSLF